MTTPRLLVRDLATEFRTRDGTARAVDGVSFELLPGETLALVGESGCGKTVTALSIMRLLPDSASVAAGSVIQFEGRDLLALDDESLRRVRGAGIAMVFQEPTTSLNPVLTVGTQIAETLRAHREVTKAAARHRAVELLDRVGIPDPEGRARQYPHELSGGMQQRVMIAIALACDPGLLIADEPTTALDVTVQAEILELLAELTRASDMSLLLITHDLGIVAGMAERVAVMYAGRIVEQAATAELFRAPGHPYTEALLAAVPRLDRPVHRLAAIPGSVPLPSAWPRGCRFHPRCRYAWDRCQQTEPELLQQGPHHTARCWLIEQPDRRAS